LVREAARRRLGMRHFDVQLIGGWAIELLAELAVYAMI
jgi:preprotein translocase subunit SecA